MTTDALRRLAALAPTLHYAVAPEDAGQIVEVGYADDDGVIIRQVYDRSDRSAAYAVACWSDVWDAVEGDERATQAVENWCIANSAPPIPDDCWIDLEIEADAE